MKLVVYRKYRSIEPTISVELPPLTVITGPNGVGKSHLLEAIHYDISNARVASDAQRHTRLVGIEVEPEEVVYMPARWNVTDAGSSLAQLQKEANAASTLLCQEPRTPAGRDKDWYAQRRRKLIAESMGLDPAQATDIHRREEIVKNLPLLYAFTSQLGIPDLAREVANVVVAYRWAAMQKQIDLGIPRHEAYEEIGPPPWKVLNDLLASADIPYEVVEPESHHLSVYSLSLRDPRGGLAVNVGSLSGGEKAILVLGMWLLTSNLGVRPKLALLDEPDAHLHPSAIPQFVAAIRDILVKRFQVNVIMTTHRAETVAALEEAEVFEMRRGGANRLSLARSKADAITLLTRDTILVAAPSRCVLVEGDDDVRFYEETVRLLRSAGWLSPTKIYFQRASTGKKKSQDGAGRSKVEAWVEKLASSGLAPAVQGIVDADDKPDVGEGIHALPRHSLESFLLDPLVVYAALLEKRLAPAVPGLEVLYSGDEGSLRRLSNETLQAIADVVAETVEANVPDLKGRTKKTIRYANGKAIEYPGWLWTEHGKALMESTRVALGDSNAIGVQPLTTAYAKVRLVPVELRDILNTIVGKLDPDEDAAQQTVEADGG